MRVLGLIPARGGSKGVIRKNLREVDGRPLLQHAIDAGLASESLTDVVVSTEDDEIAARAIKGGAEVPFRRPTALAQDATPTIAVVQQVLTALGEIGRHYEAVCLLQPTSPIRPVGLIDGCISLMQRSGADSVVTVAPVPYEFNPHWVYFAEADGRMELATGEAAPIPRRQDLPPAFHRDGRVYLTRTSVALGGSLYGRHVVGHVVEAPLVNIDTEADLSAAQSIVSMLAASTTPEGAGGSAEDGGG